MCRRISTFILEFQKANDIIADLCSNLPELAYVIETVIPHAEGSFVISIANTIWTREVAL